MLYRALLSFKHNGQYVRTGLIVDLDKEDEITMLREAEAIAEVRPDMEKPKEVNSAETEQSKPKENNSVKVDQPKPKRQYRKRKRKNR